MYLQAKSRFFPQLSQPETISFLKEKAPVKPSQDNISWQSQVMPDIYFHIFPSTDCCALNSLIFFGMRH